MRSIGAVIVFLIAALAMSACDILSNSGDAEVAPEPTATVDQAIVASAAPNVPNITLPVTPTQETGTIRVWMPPEITERTEIGVTTLSDQISAFNLDNPEVVVVVEPKRARGSGGIVDYLRSGRDVAPSVLPDLVAVPTDLLPTMATENLILTLDDRLEDDALDSLFPPALSLGRPESSVLGYPFALGTLPHLTYNNNVLTGTLPLTWELLIENDEHSYIFAADGTDGAHARERNAARECHCAYRDTARQRAGNDDHRRHRTRR